MPAILFGFLISSSISEKNHLTQFHTSTSRSVTMPACVRTFTIHIESTAITSFQRRFNEKLSIGCCRRCFLVLYPLCVIALNNSVPLFIFHFSKSQRCVQSTHTHSHSLSVIALAAEIVSTATHTKMKISLSLIRCGFFTLDSFSFKHRIGVDFRIYL